MYSRIDIDFPWDRAVRQVALDTLRQARDPAFVAHLRALHGAPCPISLAKVPRDPTDPGALIERLAPGLSG